MTKANLTLNFNLNIVKAKCPIRKIKYTGKDAWSSMFPDDMTEIQVAKSIEHVFKNGTKSGNIIAGKDAVRGIDIEIILYSNGNVKTAYPKY